MQDLNPKLTLSKIDTALTILVNAYLKNEGYNFNDIDYTSRLNREKTEIRNLFFTEYLDDNYTVDASNELFLQWLQEKETIKMLISPRKKLSETNIILSICPSNTNFGRAHTTHAAVHELDSSMLIHSIKEGYQEVSVREFYVLIKDFFVTNNKKSSDFLEYDLSKDKIYAIFDKDDTEIMKSIEKICGILLQSNSRGASSYSDKSFYTKWIEDTNKTESYKYYREHNCSVI